MRLSLIVAMDRNGLIGTDHGLPWRLPRDLRRFKELTLGKPIIMGRKTRELIGRALPGRNNIVLSSRPGADFPGCTTAASLADAIRLAATAEEVFVIGGAEIYRQALAQADRIFLTVVDGEFAGTTYFPVEIVRQGDWVETAHEIGERDEKNAYRHLFLILERCRPGEEARKPFNLAETLRKPFNTGQVR